jgi:hypothetical protein
LAAEVATLFFLIVSTIVSVFAAGTVLAAGLSFMTAMIAVVGSGENSPYPQINPPMTAIAAATVSDSARCCGAHTAIAEVDYRASA